MKTIPLLNKFLGVQQSQKLEVFVWSEGTQYAPEEVDGIYEGLWLWTGIPSKKGQQSGKWLKQERVRIQLTKEV